MKEVQKYIIHKDVSVIDAMDKINQTPETLTLFVINKQNQLIGTLTDGDIRRGFLNDKTLNTKTEAFTNKNYKSISKNIAIEDLVRIRKTGVKLLPLLDEKMRIIKIYNLSKLKSILPLSAFIMAGGEGRRLRPLTNTTPKPMIILGDKPIIEHTIDRLILYGIENFYISVNYLKNQIIDYFGDGSKKGINITYIEEENPLGTAGSISLIKDIDTDLLITNSDLFTNIDYEHLYLNFFKRNADMAVASIPYPVNIPYAILSENNGVISSFEEKPTHNYYANAGIYVIKKELVSRIPYNTFYNITDLMQNVIDTGGNLIQNPIIGFWIDIGRIEDLKKAQEIIKHR